jgi:hypothetical protein
MNTMILYIFSDLALLSLNNCVKKFFKVSLSFSLSSLIGSVSLEIQNNGSLKGNEMDFSRFKFSKTRYLILIEIMHFLRQRQKSFIVMNSQMVNSLISIFYRNCFGNTFKTA